MPNFDALHYSPPAPVAQVVLRDIATSKLLPDVLLLIDTGADMTLIPRAAVEKLGVKPQVGDEYEILGFDGTRSVAQSVELDMVFLNKAYRGRYLLIEDDRGILGRDILCNVVLSLDGPGQQWSESKAD
jgi:predicted aspartyl protease